MPIILFQSVLPLLGNLATTENADSASFSATAASPLSGSLGVTEAADTASFSGIEGLLGHLTATETAVDTASLAGITGLLGPLAATEPLDVAALAGITGLLGPLSATDAVDVAAFAGGVIADGDLAATEALDAAGFSAIFYWAGVLGVTEDIDAAAFEAIIAPWGDLAATESPEDTASFSGGIYATGNLAVTEGSVDTLSFLGDQIISGTLVVSDGGPAYLDDEIGNDLTTQSGDNLIATVCGDTASFSSEVSKSSGTWRLKKNIRAKIDWLASHEARQTLEEFYYENIDELSEQEIANMSIKYRMRMIDDPKIQALIRHGMPLTDIYAVLSKVQNDIMEEEDEAVLLESLLV